MTEQAALPEVEGLAPPPAAKTCAWCSMPATTDVEVEPPIKGKGRHDKMVMKRAAILAPACRECAQRLESRYP